MGRRRGFLPPPVCEQCGQSPVLGETLWPGNHWRCITCLQDSLPGSNCLSKSLSKLVEYRHELQDAFGLESQGLKAEGPRNRAEWARSVAVAMMKNGQARSQEVVQAQGEAVPPDATPLLYDTLTVPDLASVEASFERTDLLLRQRPGVAAMAVDASDSMQSGNSLEKMLAHQLATLHHVALDHLASMSSREDAASQAKRLHAAARCLSVYQQGLLTLKKVRQTGPQRITVQHVTVSEGGQAVIANLEREFGERGA